MYGALALMPLEKIPECLQIIKAKQVTLENVSQTKCNEFHDYFNRTWLIKWSPNVWNYYDHIGRRTTNDLENFNKQANMNFNAKNPCIFNFINFLKKCDASMTITSLKYRENPSRKPKKIQRMN